MDLMNIKVKHTKYGVGMVTEVKNGKFTVQFLAKEIKFQYPEAFEKAMKAENLQIQEDIQKDIDSIIILPNPVPIPPILVGIDEIYNVKYFARIPIYTYTEVEKLFHIRIAGFGRGINITPESVVLISSIEKKKSGFVYHDHWNKEGDYIYSGEGKTGDQIMSRGNMAIKNAAYYGKTIYLFVKLSPKEYYYQGIFELLDYTYEDDIDENKTTRKEYKFRLRKINSGV